jgi:hypothetical protein
MYVPQDSNCADNQGDCPHRNDECHTVQGRAHHAHTANTDVPTVCVMIRTAQHDARRQRCSVNSRFYRISVGTGKPARDSGRQPDVRIPREGMTPPRHPGDTQLVTRRRNYAMCRWNRDANTTVERYRASDRSQRRGTAPNNRTVSVTAAAETTTDGYRGTVVVEYS